MNYKALVFHSFVSRIFFISICTLSHFSLKHYDLSTNLNESKSIFNSLLKWDAVHFRDITMNGYLQEHTFAFFPLLPYVVRCFYTFFNGPLVFFGFDKHFTFDQFTIGILIINFIFIINSLLLYKLSLFIFDLELAKFTFYLYIFNPASIICSSMYTETLFMLLFLIGLFFVIKQKEIQSTFVLSISVLCRSNGLLFCILLFYFKWSLIHLIFFLVPIGLFQLYVLEKLMSFRIFSDLKLYLEVFNDTHNLTLDDKKALDSFDYKENLISVSETVTFASKKPLLIFKKMKIVIPYSLIQKKYWNQGFLNFFNIPNIPNALIGLPFILFTFYILLKNDLKVKNHTLLLKNLQILLFLKTFLACFFFHWNMYFRLICFNPFLYWSIAKMYLKVKRSAYFILYLKYYLAFSVAYAILFGAFYPPA